MPRPVDSGGPPHPRQFGCFCIAFGGTLTPRRPQHVYLEAVPALQGARPPLRPTGFSVYASPALFAFLRLRHGRKTRYGWEANPYPTGTFTPHEMPSFARRDNVKPKAARAPDDLAS